jgi:hypothetical protein
MNASMAALLQRQGKASGQRFVPRTRMRSDTVVTLGCQNAAAGTRQPKRVRRRCRRMLTDDDEISTMADVFQRVLEGLDPQPD